MGACTLDKPCGALAVPDQTFNRDMALYGLPQRRYRCVAGHSVMVGLPPDLAERVPDVPSKAGPKATIRIPLSA